MLRLRKFSSDDLFNDTFLSRRFCFAEGGDGDDDGGSGDDGGGGDDDGDKGSKGGDGDGDDDKGGEKAKPGLMGDAKTGDDDKTPEGDKDSGQTIDFKTDKGTETLNVPTKFWDKEGNKLNEGAVLKTALEAGKTVNKLQTELAEAKKDGPGAVDKTVPKDAAGYLKDAEGDNPFIKDGKVQLGDDPKNLKPVPIDDPVIQLFAEVAKEEGFSVERFQRIVSKVLAGVDDATPEALDLEAEAEKFGKNAGNVASANKTWAENMKTTGDISDAEYVHLLNMGQTATGLSVVNKLRVMSGGQSIPLGQGGVTGDLMSKQEWYGAKPDHRTDPVAYAKWQKDGEAIFGTGKAGSSESGMHVPPNQGGQRSSYESKT